MNEPDKYEISSKEAKRRLKKVEDFIQKKDELEDEIKSLRIKINKNATSDELMGNGSDLEEGKKATRNEAEFLTNRDILKKAREMMAFHDGKLEVVDGIATDMKGDGRAIGDELGIHNRMLQGLNDDVDNAQAQMHKVDTKLKKLLNSTNT